MPDEVIAGSDQDSGGARALPLFSFRHMFRTPMTSRTGNLILRDAAESAAPQDEVLRRLMVRSAATPRVSNHEAVGCLTMTRLNWKMT